MPRRGLPAAIIKKYGVTKKAWSVFRGRKGSKKSKGGGRMARRRGGRRGGFTIPMALVAGLSVPPIRAASAQGAFPGRVDAILKGNTLEAQALVSDWMAHYIGYVAHANVWRWDYAAVGWGTLLLGAVAHKVAGLLGVNRALGRAKVPLLRI